MDIPHYYFCTFIWDNAYRGNTKPLNMGVDSNTLAAWLADYDPGQITIGVVASHSSLQILHGARLEGFKTLETLCLAL